MMFKVGQRVVCIRDDWHNGGEEGLRFIGLPKEGRIYTVRRNYIAPWGSIRYTIQLFEIINIESQWRDEYGEPRFDATAFRPLEETEVETEIKVTEDA